MIFYCVFLLCSMCLLWLYVLCPIVSIVVMYFVFYCGFVFCILLCLCVLYSIVVVVFFLFIIVF
jgi:hypothetical protein